MRSVLRWFASVFAVVLLCPPAVSPILGAEAEGSFERTLKVSGLVELDVSTGAGNISVRAGEAGSVRVHGRIRASRGWNMGFEDAERKVRQIEANPPIEQEGNSVRIGRIDDSELRRNISISYEIVTPADTRLNSKTGSGSETVEGIRGPLKASTGSGGIKISNIGDEVRAETGSGHIELDSVKGEVRASTGSGTIRAHGVAGGFVARTGSGDVTLEQTAPGSVKVETGSGSSELSGVKGSLVVRTGSGGIRASGEQTEEWSLHTGSGGVTVRLPANAAFDVDAHTHSGRISTDHPITVQGTIGRGELRGKVRGGGFRLIVLTGSGDIRIE